MPAISNAKHEYFAQELAKGKTADEAYQLAGYKANRHNASRLKTNETILGRVAEIMERKAVRAEVTVSVLSDMLFEDRKLARDLGQPAAAVSAVEKLAKLHGLMIERKEVRTGNLDELPADSITELREQLIAERARRLNSGSGSEAPRKPH
jgi:phage terminase small subunit